MLCDSSFGVYQGRPVEAISLSNGTLACRVLTFGGILQSLQVPDRQGKTVDVVLGCPSLEGYLAQDCYLGALVGRCANRIARGHFVLDGRDYALAVNNGPNHLHGGPGGFSFRVWDVASRSPEHVTLSLHSPDGEEGYPGNMDVRVTYRLEGNALSITYEAETDQATLCNLTNHSYFNLAGHDSGPVLDQVLQLMAHAYTPTDETSIPTGELASVAGTPMDFLTPTPIGARIDAPFPQLIQGRGYDHNWCVDGQPGVLRPAARAWSEKTGIVLSVETTMPGVQLYTANYVPEGLPGKGGALYGPRHAFCLETQFYPDAVNHPDFPSPILTPDQPYRHQTRITFSPLTPLS